MPSFPRQVDRPRILLLAFSGVRVLDPEIARLGLTLPGFAERARRIAALPSLGLLSIAARTPGDFEVVYRDVDSVDPGFAARVADERFELVAISALSARIADAYALADELRSRDVRVVLGGLHASALPDEAEQHADAVVEGEGEAAWPRLCADLRSGTLARRYTATPAEHADSFASDTLPRFDLCDRARYDRMTVQTMRGCPFDCAFCGASRTIAPFRRKPLELVERELQAAVRVARRGRIELADDNTFADARRGRELARILRESGAIWFTETDLSVADDPELVEALAGARCAGLLIGLESPSRAALEGLDTRRFKLRQLDRHREKIERLQAHGLPVTGCFVVGFDEDGPDVFERTLEAAAALDLADVQVTILTPFPGTPLRERLAREGRLDDPARWDRLTLFDVAYEPKHMSRSELTTGFRALVKALHTPRAVERRARRRRDCLRIASARARSMAR